MCIRDRRYIKGTLAIAHNGNLTNAYELRKELERGGAIFQTTIDSEVIAYVVADVYKRQVPCYVSGKGKHRVCPDGCKG